MRSSGRCAASVCSTRPASVGTGWCGGGRGGTAGVAVPVLLTMGGNEDGMWWLLGCRGFGEVGLGDTKNEPRQKDKRRTEKRRTQSGTQNDRRDGKCARLHCKQGWGANKREEEKKKTHTDCKIAYAVSMAFFRFFFFLLNRSLCLTSSRTPHSPHPCGAQVVASAFSGRTDTLATRLLVGGAQNTRSQFGLRGVRRVFSPLTRKSCEPFHDSQKSAFIKSD